MAWLSGPCGTAVSAVPGNRSTCHGNLSHTADTAVAHLESAGQGTRRWWRGAWASVLGASLLGLVLVGVTGCGRAFYRRQADREVNTLVHSAANDPRWPLEGFTIQPDPKSRMYDPFDLDRPPMPPDDPTSHRLMHCVDCKRGWPCWHCSGDTPYVENPAWKAYLPENEQGGVVLDRDGAMQTALLHSREYQREVENVYLSALDVTLQQFQFDAQFFGGHSTFFDAEGRLAGGQSLLSVDNDLQMRRFLATGGELVVGAANSLVWQFAGPDSYSANTLLDFSLVQPLLRAGGRAVVLESLTASERALLADIRSMERFRRSFCVQTVVDHLRLLEDQVLIRNQEINVVQLRQSLERLQAMSEAGVILPGDVARTRQSLYSSQSGLLALNAAHESRLDGYKVSLGLPPDLDVRIEDPLLGRFDLIAPKLTATRQAVDALLPELRKLYNQLTDLLDQLGELKGAENIDQEDYRQTLRSVRQGALGQLDEARLQLQDVENDMEQLRRALPGRRRSLQRLAEREEFRQGNIDPSIGDVKALDDRVATLQRDFARVAEDFSGIQQGLESFDAESATVAEELNAIREARKQAATEGEASKNAAGPKEGEKTPLARLEGIVEGLSNHLLGLSLIQAQARLDAMTLVPIELTSEKALEIARENRRDWMNARAALVDTWRQIEVRANDLKSGLDVTFSGDINTTDNNPVQFRSSTGHLRAGLEFDAPLTRLAERNAYRQALINYQRARRDYYAFEDGVSQSLRDRLRTIRFNQLDFEVQRAAVQVAISRVDETGRRLNEPPKQLGGQGAPNQSIVERLLSDFSSLLSAQNRFLAVWVGQEVQRMNLDLDLETMQLDSRGMWIDPGPIEGSKAGEGERPEQLEEAPLPPGGAEPIPLPAGEPVGPDPA